MATNKTAHSFESKERSEDVKIHEDVLFADLHLSSPVLAGEVFWFIHSPWFNLTFDSLKA